MSPILERILLAAGIIVVVSDKKKIKLKSKY
jgi:hypothetical protein